MLNPNQPRSAATSISEVKKQSWRSGLLHFSMVELLIVLLMLLVSAPVLVEWKYGGVVESGLVTLVLVASVMAVGGRRRTLFISLVLVMPAVVTRWVNHVQPESLSEEIKLFSSLVFMLFVIGCLISFILRAPRVNTEVLCAAIAGYLLLGLVWGYAYMIVGWQDPDAFSYARSVGNISAQDPFHATYFSFITLTTTGYGDIAPVSNMARTLAVMESIAGTFYLTILIARLVAVYSRRTAEADASEG